MSFEDSTKKLRKHRFGIKEMLSNPELRELSEETGKLGHRMMLDHNLQGNYLGGDYANKPYSTTNLPLFFFGNATLVERTGNVRLSAPEMNIGSLLIKREDIYWSTDSQGNKMMWLRGGYATFLKYARPGKNLEKVDHQFTGQMLNAFTYDITFTTKGSEIRWYVRPPHDAKAAYTNAKRQWMGFFDEELEQVAEMASQKFGLIIYEKLKID